MSNKFDLIFLDCDWHKLSALSCNYHCYSVNSILVRSHQQQTVSVCPFTGTESTPFSKIYIACLSVKNDRNFVCFVLYRRSCMLCTTFMQLTQICQVRKINKIINKWTVTNCGLMCEWYVNKSASRIVENLGKVIGWPSSQFLLRRRWTN